MGTIIENKELFSKLREAGVGRAKQGFGSKVVRALREAGYDLEKHKVVSKKEAPKEDRRDSYFTDIKDKASVKEKKRGSVFGNSENEILGN